MTVKGAAKFDEKQTVGSKNDMRNLVNFNASSLEICTLSCSHRGATIY